MRRMKFVVEGSVIREFDIALADGKPDLFVFAEATDLQGKTVRIEVDRLPAGSQGLNSILAADEAPGEGELYREKHRPQFHFTSRRGWLNDPNGLVYFQGEWHLFYQHNPYGLPWGNMHWGHAVSRDLLHWRELPIALYPPRYGDWCFSGSAVVDEKNTSGFQSGAEPPIVAAFTSTARGEAIVFSNDRGRTFQEFSENPVVTHAGRDPRILWHGPTRRWVMAVYDEAEGKQWIAFYSSPDLKAWTWHSRIEGFYECPDLFELPIDGDAQRTAWVLYAADGRYVLGDFDGREFRPRTEKQQLWHGAFYAAQTFSNAPAGRRIQIGWARGIPFPGMPFNQQMTIPVELTLRTTGQGVRMFAEPVRELESLRRKSHARTSLIVEPGEVEMNGVSSELLDLSARLDPAAAKRVGLVVRGIPVVYDAEKRELTCRDVTVPLAPLEDVVHLRVLVDRGSLEIFGNDGLVAISLAAIPPEGNRSIRVFAEEGAAMLQSLTVHELQSTWEGRRPVTP
jgi:fructan beta-fructosidase